MAWFKKKKKGSNRGKKDEIVGLHFRAGRVPLSRFENTTALCLIIKVERLTLHCHLNVKADLCE
jgi:hypothetical protein